MSFSMASMLRILVYSLVSVVLVLFLLPVVDPYGRIESYALAQWYKLFKHETEPTVIDCPCVEDEDENRWPFHRVEFGAKPGATVYGWPAKGGLYVLDECLGLELDFLDLNRFEAKVRPGYDASTGRLLVNSNGSTPLNPAQEQERKQREEEEERLCDKMRMLGPRWYNSAFALSEEWLERTVFKAGMNDGDMPYFKTCWPSSGEGVWILNTTRARAAELGAGRIYNARDMDERCQIIESIGGVYYADPKQSGLDLP